MPAEEATLGAAHVVSAYTRTRVAPVRPRGPLMWLDSLLGAKAPMAAFDSETSIGLGFAPWLALLGSISVLISALAANASRAGYEFSVPVFYGAIALLFVPAAARIVHPAASRRERLTLVMVVATALFAIRIVREPAAFIDHDEFLHWLTTSDILLRHRLFTPNPLLPVSPLFPGLEIVTSAIAELSGASVFVSSLVLLGVGRLVFMGALFLAYEKISGSARIAAIGSLIYMGCSTFLVFDAHYSYESLAIVFVALAWCAEALAETNAASAWRISLAFTLPCLLALSLTHHMSAFFAAAMLVGVAALDHIRTGFRRLHVRVLFVAGCALLFPLAWAHVVGDPTAGYLGPVFSDGLQEVGRLFSFNSGRKLFVSDDGVVAPAWQRYITIMAVGAICLGLSSGFIRSLRAAGLGWMRPALWTNSRLVLLTLLTLAYPASILFRLTRSGWEIGNRVGALSFIGVGLIVAVAVAAHWQGSSRSRLRALALGGVGAVILIGGVISGEGPWILVPAHFKVSADAASIEAMDVSAASWTRQWLGPGNMFATDRINRLLLANYGRQDVATTLADPRDTSIAILSDKFGREERHVLADVGVQYVLVDLRLTTALPAVGVYFDGAITDRSYVRPPAPKALLKFDAEPSVGRPFDNGYLIIYSVKALDDAR